MQVGDQIVTSYISDKYLQGILIGYVSEVNVDSNNLTRSGYIIPAVDFKNIQEVLVITTTKAELTGERDLRRCFRRIGEELLHESIKNQAVRCDRRHSCLPPICSSVRCFPSWSWREIRPNLLIIVTAAFGFMRGSREGMLVGFFSGLFVDIQFGDMIGFYALIYLLIGFINGLFEQMYFDEDIKLPLFLIVISEIYLWGCYLFS